MKIEIELTDAEINRIRKDGGVPGEVLDKIIAAVPPASLGLPWKFEDGHVKSMSGETIGGVYGVDEHQRGRSSERKQAILEALRRGQPSDDINTVVKRMAECLGLEARNIDYWADDRKDMYGCSKGEYWQVSARFY